MDAENCVLYFGLCKCCIADGCFRNLWDVYYKDGRSENYGEMLSDCFALDWQKPDTDHLEQICETCIQSVRDAYIFKMRVLACQQQLVRPEVTVIVKTEESDGDYDNVEYLEINMDEDQNQEFQTTISKIEQPLVVETKRKWPKKKAKADRMKTYKNYPEDDLRKSVNAVLDNSMTIVEAAEVFGVPRKTVAARVANHKRRAKLGVPEPMLGRQFKLSEEIKTILTYTNATPFKTKTTRYHCAYCGTESPFFEDPDDLRTHTRTQHASDRTKNVEMILKPFWLNEVLKIDVSNLHCSVCCVILTSWNGMFRHLIDNHNLEFDEAYAKVIPFCLENVLKCVLCKEPFPNYHHLDAHMNCHYNSYMCSECGDTFLAENRLKKHLKIHKTGRFPCSHCGKVFSLDKYRNKHINFVHKQTNSIKCLYCTEKFHGLYPRHLHVMLKHPEKVKTITCELCGKTFDWRPYFLAHVRRKHMDEKNYKCDHCDATFFMKSEVKRHIMSHTGEKFACQVCSKKYSTKHALNVHYKEHGEDRVRPRLRKD